MDTVMLNPYAAWIVGFPLLGALLNGFLLPVLGRLLPASARESLTSRATVHAVAVLSVFLSFCATLTAALYLWKGDGARYAGLGLIAALGAAAVGLGAWTAWRTWRSLPHEPQGWREWVGLGLRLLFPTAGLLIGVGVLAALASTGAGGVFTWLGWTREAEPPSELLSRLWVWLPLADVARNVPGFHDFNVQAANVTVPVNFSLDRLSTVMALTVTGVSTLIHVYSMGYMGHDRSYRRYFTYLNLFVFSMLVLVLADNLVLMFVGWEGVGLCSYLLIGFWFDKEANAAAGKKAFIVNRIGDLAFILGILLIASALGTVSFRSIDLLDGSSVVGMREVIAERGAGALGHTFLGTSGAFLACLLLFVGAAGKSAQIPLYVWLPDAMAGPTPVSALIHAATMVTAGVYLIARLGFLYVLSPTAMAVVATVGAATALLAAIIGVTQFDIKRVLAYSTISQLGYMFLAVGVGAFSPAIFHLFTHAFFKACLFLGAGAVIHALADRQDLREMGGLRKVLPVTHWTFLVSTLAIAGFPPFSGFFSKDEILWSAFSGTLITQSAWVPSWWPMLLWLTALVTAGLTAFYMFRCYLLAFWGESRAPAEVRGTLTAPESKAWGAWLWTDPHTPASMRIPLMILGGLAAVAGFFGMPHLFHVGNPFARWLRPAVLPFEGRGPISMEWILLAVSVLVAVLGAWLAFQMYRAWPAEAAGRLVARFPRTYRLVFDKFRIDELYEWLIVRPLRFLAFVAYEVIDRLFIDTFLVTGLAFLTRGVGALLRKFQGGVIHRYAAMMAIGAAGVLYFVAQPFATVPYLERPVVFVTYEGQAGADGAAQFRVRLPVAPYRYEFDFDSDGEVDREADPHAPRWNEARTADDGTVRVCLPPGEYEVTVRAVSRFGLTRTERLPLTIGPAVYCEPEWTFEEGGEL